MARRVAWRVVEEETVNGVVITRVSASGESVYYGTLKRCGHYCLHHPDDPECCHCWGDEQPCTHCDGPETRRRAR